MNLTHFRPEMRGNAEKNKNPVNIRFVAKTSDIRNFKYVLSTMGVSKESISKFLIGNPFHVKLRILSPENCKQSLRVKSWKAEVTAEKKNKLKTKTNIS